MSELGFTGKIPIPNLTKFGDISGAADRANAMAMQRGVLEQKRQAAQAKAAVKTKAQKASFMANLGGLYEDIHPFALPFVEEAYTQLQQEVMPFMGMDNGADFAKPMIENFKASVDRYKINRDMTAAETDLAQMIDPQSPITLKKNKELGDFYKVSSDMDYLSAAQDFEYKGLMEGAKLEYKNGQFNINGLAVDPASGAAAEISELSLHPYFNSERAFTPRTEMISPDTLEDFGKEIRGTEMASNRPWNEERISGLGVEGGYGSYYNQYLDFNSVNKEESAPFNWRRRSFFDNKDAIRDRSVTANSLSDDDLFSYFQLDPKKKENVALYGMVQEAMKSSWRTTLEHTKYNQSKTASKGAQVQSLYNSGANALVTDATLPADPTGIGLYAAIATEDGKVNKATYDIINLSSPTMENLAIPAYNEEYFKDLAYFVTTNLLAIDPNNGNVIPGPKFQDAEDMQGIEEFMIKGNEVSKYKIQGVAVYENNPDVYSVMTDGGTEISINPDELNWYTQPIHNAVLIGLDKSVGLKISEIYANAEGRFWNSPAGPPAGTSTGPTPPAGTSTGPTPQVDAWGNPLPVEE